MKISKNDPRLTAFILNELEPGEMILIEQALVNDPELRVEVNRLRQSVNLLKTLKDSEVYNLAPAQREKILAQRKPAWNIWALGGGVATACLALMLYRQNVNQMKAQSEYAAAPVMQEAAKLMDSAPAAKGQLAAEKKMAKPPARADEALGSAVSAAAPAPAAPPAEAESLARNEEAAGASSGAAADSLAFSQSRNAVMAKGKRITDEPEVRIQVALTPPLPDLLPGIYNCFVKHGPRRPYDVTYKLIYADAKLQVADPVNTGLLTPEMNACLLEAVKTRNPGPFVSELKVIAQ